MMGFARCTCGDPGSFYCERHSHWWSNTPQYIIESEPEIKNLNAATVVVTFHNPNVEVTIRVSDIGEDCCE